MKKIKPIPQDILDTMAEVENNFIVLGAEDLFTHIFLGALMDGWDKTHNYCLRNQFPEVMLLVRFAERCFTRALETSYH